MPSHNHSMVVGAAGDTRGTGGSNAFLGGTTTGNAGGGAAHNNLQPYKTVVYMIKF